mmetsp:Transcript_37541/g.86748  ORF Transcript_37541/g.86748 Transcript_37541/m.86748 type:complete len:224 (-) Transcript_37541:3850-4521(-)
MAVVVVHGVDARVLPGLSEAVVRQPVVDELAPVASRLLEAVEGLAQLEDNVALGLDLVGEGHVDVDGLLERCVEVGRLEVEVVEASVASCCERDDELGRVVAEDRAEGLVVVDSPALLVALGDAARLVLVDRPVGFAFDAENEAGLENAHAGAPRGLHPGAGRVDGSILGLDGGVPVGGVVASHCLLERRLVRLGDQSEKREHVLVWVLLGQRRRGRAEDARQ